MNVSNRPDRPNFSCCHANIISHLVDQAKPVRDSPELFAACFRCGASNPLLSPFTAGSSSLGSLLYAPSSSFSHGRGGGGGGVKGRHSTPLPWGDACTTCRHPFVRSFFNFESLPLVEFQPDPGCAFSSVVFFWAILVEHVEATRACIRVEIVVFL